MKQNLEDLLECPKCGNKGDAFPMKQLKTEFGNICYKECNNCGVSFVDITNVVKILKEHEEKLKELKDENEELENQVETLEQDLRKIKNHISAPNEEVLPNPEPSF